MPTSKTASFGALEIKLAELAKALGHPARVAILMELARRNSCVCGEIVDVLPLAQSTVSQHLKALKDAGWISGTVEGAKSCYCINKEALLHFRSLLTDFLDVQDNTCC